MIAQHIQTHHFRNSLLAWYHIHKRDLPFRQTKDPYKIWLSEIMLQQTTMTVVLDYYKRFIKKFPTVTSVAQTNEHDLLILWQGLGYYSRIRNFQKACKIVVQDFNGIIPTTFDELKKLPGIGDYTAAAISSICFGEPRAVVDGNVKRVLARLFHFAKDPATTQAQKFFRDTAQKLIDPQKSGDFNQAIMELGALVCTPKQPACKCCPVRKHCASFEKNPELLPLKNKMKWIDKRVNLLVAHSKTRVLLRKPTADNQIQGMWELPTSPLITHHSSPITIHHTITNKRITAHILSKKLTDSQLTKQASDDLECLAWKDLANLPLSTLSRKALVPFLRRSS